MNTFIPCGLSLCLLISHLHAGDSSAREKIEYRRLGKTNDRTLAVVKKLQAIKLRDVAIEGLTPSAALEALRSKVVGERGGVINFVVRGTENGQKVTFKSDITTYADAIDHICEQTGRVWKIDFNDQTGTPILVIGNKGRQDAP